MYAVRIGHSLGNRTSCHLFSLFTSYKAAPLTTWRRHRNVCLTTASMVTTTMNSVELTQAALGNENKTLSAIRLENS